MKDFNVEDIVEKIKADVAKERDDPFKPRSYYEYIDKIKTYYDVIIVGAGERGKILFDLFEINNPNAIICFADNSSKNYPKGQSGKEVISLEQATIKFRNARYIITPQNHIMQLIRQLVKLGIDIDNIDFFEPRNIGINK